MSEIELKAILFDLDGTIIDSEPVYGEVFNKWMWEQGISFQQQDRINAQLIPGITWADCLYIVSQVTGKRLDVKKAQAEIVRAVEQQILDVGVPMKEGIRPALEQLSQQFQLAVVSSSPAKVVERALRHHSLQQYFQQITSLEDVTYPKPHPEPYTYTLQQLQVKPEQALAMEDSLAGAQSASAAGIFVYTWPDKAFRAEQFAQFGKVVYSFDELLRDVL